MHELSATAQRILAYFGDRTKDEVHRTASGTRISLNLSKHELLTALDDLMRRGLVRQQDDWYELTPAGRQRVEQAARSTPGVTATISGSPGAQQAVGSGNIQVGSVEAKGPVNIGGTQTVGDVAGGDLIKIEGGVGPGAAVGSGAHVEAENIAGGDITIGVGGEELAKLFAEWNARVAALPADDQEVVAPMVKQVQAQAEKLAGGDESEETQNRLAQRLKNLVNMAPDIGDVVIASLVNPAAGIAMVIKKVAGRVRRELGSEEA